MINKEKILNSQNVGLDLTNIKSDEIISGYMHVEKINNINENKESETLNKSHHIKTKFIDFIKGI